MAGERPGLDAERAALGSSFLASAVHPDTPTSASVFSFLASSTDNPTDEMPVSY